jgi:hypothetical protein
MQLADKLRINRRFSGLLPTLRMNVLFSLLCLLFSTDELKMDAECSSETSVNAYRTTRHHISGHREPQNSCFTARIFPAESRKFRGSILCTAIEISGDDIQFNSLFISTVIGQLQSQHEYKQQHWHNTGQKMTCEGYLHSNKVKSKATPVTSHGGPYGCEMSRLPHFLDSRLTDGGEISLTRRPPFTPQEDSWYSFLLEAESTLGP